MDIEKLVTAYFEVFQIENEDIMAVPFMEGLPQDMLVGPPNEENWVAWKLVPGTLELADYDPLEQRIGCQLPPSFKEWHRRFFSLDGLQVAGIALPGTPSNNPFGPLEDAIFDQGCSDEAIPLGIIPFGWVEDEGAWACFDARQPREGNEWPILLLDHELEVADALQKVDRERSVGEADRPTFVDLLEAAVRHSHETY
ncbi:MAG: SMI1/KNR4 family protein [Blastocatellia bacterium]|nr:SMI1/KNR4 family protein [Blastocatellia bacterium]